MTDGWIRTLVEAIHASRSQAVLYLSGGASQAPGYLISVPGASNTVLEVVIPYSRMSMIQLLSKIPKQFTCQETAEDMALAAYNRALQLSTTGSKSLRAYVWYPSRNTGFKFPDKGKRFGRQLGFTQKVLASTR